MARDLNWEKITSLVESGSSSTAILIKGKIGFIIWLLMQRFMIFQFIAYL